MKEITCKVCGDKYKPVRQKTRPTCNKRSCNNRWTWVSKIDYYREKKLKQYYTYKDTKPGYVEEINKKAKSVQRYGVVDREAFIEERGGCCANCGDKEARLVIHHIDNNGRRAEKDDKDENNDPNNLMVLCPRCHVCHHVYDMTLEDKYSTLVK